MDKISTSSTIIPGDFNAKIGSTTGQEQEEMAADPN